MDLKKYGIIEINSTSTLLEILYNHKKIASCEMSRNYFSPGSWADDEIDMLFFRGEARLHPFVIPSLYQNENLTMNGSEFYYRSLFCELGREDYDNNSTLVRTLSELQHYGAKTRLLDVCRSPLIALFFAVEKHPDEDGYIFIYEGYKGNIKFDTGDTVAIKTALNLMPQNRIDCFFDVCDEIQNIIGPDKLFYPIDKMMNDPKLAKGIDFLFLTRFLVFLKQRAKVNVDYIYPRKIRYDLSFSHIVIPTKSTDRIRQQQGAFIYPRFVKTSGMTYTDVEKGIEESICQLMPVFSYTSSNGNRTEYSIIKIPKEYKEKIKKELSLLGISEGFVYPEIENQSKSLLEKL